MSKFDLSQAIFDKIEELGIDAAAAFFGRTSATVKKWASTTAQPDITACQRILDAALETGELDIPAFATPPPQGLTIPEPAPAIPIAGGETFAEYAKEMVEAGKLPIPKFDPPAALVAVQPSKRFSMVCPIHRDMSFAVVLSMLGQWKATVPEEIRKELATLDFENDTLIHRSRNILAARFLESGNEWSFWMDSDIIAPTGNPGWYKRRTKSTFDPRWSSYSAIERLAGRGKTLIGGVYAERDSGGKLITQSGIHPVNEEEKRFVQELKKTGPRDEVKQEGWIGFGCVVVHRRVFEDILRTQPNVQGQNGNPPGFFTAYENGPQGEDVAFCKRALLAGHPSFLDLSVFCGHIGKQAYMP